MTATSGISDNAWDAAVTAMDERRPGLRRHERSAMLMAAVDALTADGYRVIKAETDRPPKALSPPWRVPCPDCRFLRLVLSVECCPGCGHD